MACVVGFSYPNTFKPGALAISVWQRSNYSHCYIRFNDIVIHSAKGSVHELTYDQFISENVVIKEFFITEDQSMLENARLFLNTPYGYMELLKIFTYDVCNTFGIKLSFANSPGLICSEYISLVLSQYLGLTFHKPSYLLTPKDIYLKLDQYGKTL